MHNSKDKEIVVFLLHCPLVNLNEHLMIIYSFLCVQIRIKEVPIRLLTGCIVQTINFTVVQ
jgi:hypothetical protein